jgi:rubrerythrin
MDANEKPEDRGRDLRDCMTRNPAPEPGTPKAVAYGILDSVLNLMLNRHIHVLKDHGYLNSGKYDRDSGWDGEEPRKALKLKWELMDEAQDRFTDLIIRALTMPSPLGQSETRCRKCGCILRGISEPRCPECGERI